MYIDVTLIILIKTKIKIIKKKIMCNNQYPKCPNVIIKEILIRGRERKMKQNKRFMKLEEGNTGQGIQAASRSWKR